MRDQDEKEEKKAGRQMSCMETVKTEEDEY